MSNRPRRRIRADVYLAALLIFPIFLFAVCDAHAEEDDLDALIGGFDDDSDFAGSDEIDEAGSGHPAWLARLPFGEWIAEHTDLSGSLGVGAAYSYLDHKVPHGDEVGRSTSYGNLTRLDVNGFLQLDVELPGSWKIRAEAVGWYDFVYRIKGRGNYGGEVIDVYEWQVDSGEVYLAGPLSQKVDLTIGRKVVNWGRSDTFRVVDVINPLDNKEPGLVDIEYLRRPRAMVKLDATSGAWSGQILVIPENRFDRQPPPGSDFFPPGQSKPPIDGEGNFAGVPGFAGKIDGRFSGWDFSIYGAYVDQTSRVFDLDGPNGPRAEANRFGMLGAGGNVTRGPWLLKFEFAWLTDVRVIRVQSGTPLIPSSDDKDQIDSMLGVEYYGTDDLTIALEIVNRHLLNEPKGKVVPLLIQRTPQSRFETSLRISRPFFRERLKLNALAVGFGERLQNGGVLRFFGDYDLNDSWNLESGILLFIGGSDQGVGAFDSNDRLYLKIQYHF